jgi:hypothetical protein
MFYPPPACVSGSIPNHANHLILFELLMEHVFRGITEGVRDAEAVAEGLAAWENALTAL